MAAEFSFRRSVYQPWLDESALHDQYAIREYVANIGQHGGNFWNWTGGAIDYATTWLDTTQITSELKPILGDVTDPTVFHQFPLSPSFASVEVYIRAHFGIGSGGTSAISNVHLLATRIDLTGYGDGAFLNGRIVDYYPTGDPALARVNLDGRAGPLYQPINHGSVGGTPTVMQQSQDPDQGYLDLTPGDGLTPGSTAYSRYAVLQMHTGANPVPGEAAGCDFALYYDES